MKTFQSVFILSLVLMSTVRTNAQNMLWTKQMANTSNNGNNSARGNGIAIDAVGNAYTIGFFYQDTVDFDPGPGTYYLNSPYSSSAFISKLDASGNFVWAKKIGGDSAVDNANGYSIALDVAGNVFIMGLFTGTIDFDPGPGVYNLSTISYAWNNFIAKLDASGNLIWAKQMASDSISGADDGGQITVDISGNVYTTGQFSGTVDYDPGPGIHNLISISVEDIFISKLDSAGNFIWVKQMVGDSDGWAYSNSIALDAGGNVYTTGDFHGTVDFDPGPGTLSFIETGNYGFNVAFDIFISKLDSAGNLVWAKQIGTNVTGGGTCSSNSIALSNFSTIYIAGHFRGTIDFDPGPGTYLLNSTNSNIANICELDTSGNFVWAKDLEGVSHGNSVTTDIAGNVYVTGDFWGTVDFDPGAGINNLTTLPGNGDGFILKLDVPGNFVWAKQLHKVSPSAIPCNPSSIAYDAGGNIYVTGGFGGTVDFDPGSGSFNLTAVAQSDIFVYKMDPLPTSVLDDRGIKWKLYIYPNPLSNHTTISFSLSKPQNISLKVFDVKGRLVSTLADKIFEAGENELVWNADGVNAGIYFLRMEAQNNTEILKITLIN